MINKIKYWLVATVLLCVAAASFAITPQAAEKLFYDKQYAEAARAYKTLLKGAPHNTLYNYRYARCQYELDNNEEAITYFRKSGTKYPLTNFYIAEAYFRDYQFAQAESHFATYQAAIDTANANWNIVSHRIQQCKAGKRYIKRVSKLEYLDTMVVERKAFLNAYNLSAETGKLQQTDSVHVSYVNSMANRRISARNSAGRSALFVSEKLINGWTEMVPFYGNSEADVNYPFLLNDGITLYFASDSPDGLGGYDIYTTRYNSDSNDFLKAENLGFPFNSPYNDYMLAIDETAGIGYFATDRRCSADSVIIVKFRHKDETRQYFSATDNDTVVRLQAQIRNITLSNIKPEIVEDNSAQNNTETDNTFTFVVTDGIVYHKYSDFRSKEAKELYVALEQDLRKYNRNIANLEQLRIRYAGSDSAQRQELANTILQLEQAVAEQPKKIKAIENQVRVLETNVK